MSISRVYSVKSQDPLRRLFRFQGYGAWGVPNLHWSNFAHALFTIEEGQSGWTEKANDLMVVRRLKDPIRHWTREGADPVIQHRTAFMNQKARDRSARYDVAFGYTFH